MLWQNARLKSYPLTYSGVVSKRLVNITGGYGFGHASGVISVNVFGFRRASGHEYVGGVVGSRHGLGQHHERIRLRTRVLPRIRWRRCRETSVWGQIR